MTLMKIFICTLVLVKTISAANIPEEFVGTWDSGCSTDDPIMSSWDKFKIGKDFSQRYGALYQGHGCALLYLTWKSDLNLVFGKKSEFVDDAIEVDAHYSNHEITLQSLDAVYRHNINKICGFNDWKLFTPRKVSAKCIQSRPDNYTIFAVRREGVLAADHLYFGSYFGGIYDGSTPELRHRVMYEDFHTRSLLRR